MVALLGIYPEKTIIRKDTCTPMFIAALFTVVKTWKQPKCPSTDEWIKKMWYTHTHTHTHTHKIHNGILFFLEKEGNSPFRDSMDEPGEHYAT